MIGVATLRALAAHPNPLAASPPVKIPRSAVRAIVARSLVLVWSNLALRAHASRHRPRLAPPDVAESAATPTDAHRPHGG